MKSSLNSRTTSKKRTFMLMGALLLLLLIYTATAWKIHSWPFLTSSTSPDPDATRNVTNYPSPKNNNPPSKQNTTAPATSGQTSNNVPVNTGLVATITQLEETNNQVIFSAKIQNTTSAGTCVVTFSNPNDRPVTQQSVATNSNSTSICGPVDIPADEFSYLGSWQVSFLTTTTAITRRLHKVTY